MNWLIESVGGPAVIVLVGALVSAVAAFLAASKETKQRHRVAIFLGAVLAAGGAVLAAHQEAMSQRELRAKSKELAHLSQETQDLITGGESFCFITIMEPFIQENVAGLHVLHWGDIFPLYDVQANIVDQDEYDARGGLDVLLGESVSIGNMAPGTAMILDSTLQVQPGDHKRYTIRFSGRNGFWEESFLLRRLGGAWLKAIRVRRLVTPPTDSPDTRLFHQTVYEHIDAAYPRNDQGQVDW